MITHTDKYTYYSVTQYSINLHSTKAEKTGKSTAALDLAKNKQKICQNRMSKWQQ